MSVAGAVVELSVLNVSLQQVDFVLADGALVTQRLPFCLVVTAASSLRKRKMKRN